VYGRLDKMTNSLRRVRFPSTTTRHPSSLFEWQKYKATELRVCLLFGYVIFKGVLPKKYYNHFTKLVLSMHLAESREVTNDDVEHIHRLTHSFVYDFPLLYTERHNVQVVHSVIHIAATVQDYGPLTSFTTFNWESDLG
jgi:hypothetical protein